MADEKKPKLSDVIGGFVASVAHARSTADLAALRIAHHYRQNEFLAGMPVPRLRFRNVTVSLPVVVTEVIAERPAVVADASDIEQKCTDLWRKCINETQKAVADMRRLQNLPADEIALATKLERLLKLRADFLSPPKGALKTEIDEALQKIARQGAGGASDVAIADAVADAVVDYFNDILAEQSFLYVQQRLAADGVDAVAAAIAQAQSQTSPPLAPAVPGIVQTAAPEQSHFDPVRARKWFDDELRTSEQITDLFSRLRAGVAAACILSPTVPPDFFVSVDTNSVKTAGTPGSIVQLSFVLNEEGLEWLQETAEDGTVSKRLLPE